MAPPEAGSAFGNTLWNRLGQRAASLLFRMYYFSLLFFGSDREAATVFLLLDYRCALCTRSVGTARYLRKACACGKEAWPTWSKSSLFIWIMVIIPQESLSWLPKSFRSTTIPFRQVSRALGNGQITACLFSGSQALLQCKQCPPGRSWIKRERGLQRGRSQSTEKKGNKQRIPNYNCLIPLGNKCFQ